ncbi:aquaporin-4-like [Conger conger]|uniref:aquaporin-4-like n=1 Tax=Conger conger TaxID=82655 RepID=UPI002A59BCC6|nr:aquaporin-4-like [Conger conger]
MFALREVLTKRFLRAITGEFVATLIFILVGLSSTKWAGKEDTPESSTLLLISLCFGLSITTMVFCFSRISGAHINPAVTVAMVFSRKMNMDKAFFYLAAQCLGAIAGTAILYVVTPKAEGGPFGVTMLNADVSLLQGVAVELLITFQLVFTVFATCDPQYSEFQGTAALAIGFAVAIGHLFAVPYTGASMNPARSLGPAIMAWNWESHWVYWVGPIAGGLIAAILYKYLCHPHLQFKECVLGEFPKNSSQQPEETESFHIPHTDTSPKSGWLQSLRAFLLEKTENTEPKPLSAIDEKTTQSPEPVCVLPPDAERVEDKGSVDYPRYQLNLKF